MPVIPATQEAEIRRISFWSQPRENSLRDPILKKNPSQKRAGGVAQGVGPQFNSGHPNRFTFYFWSAQLMSLNTLKEKIFSIF
jgi:hypothetical protein